MIFRHFHWIIHNFFIYASIFFISTLLFLWERPIKKRNKIYSQLFFAIFSNQKKKIPKKLINFGKTNKPIAKCVWILLSLIGHLTDL